jgi:CHAT domain-containing protein
MAQVAAGGLNTRVNGTALGRCVAGICSVQGGTAVGRQVFHRFSQFDTRSGIRRVDLDTRGRRHVVVGVAHPTGSFLGAPLRLSEDANLFWLSPGGLWLGPGARFPGATNLLLTTAAALRFGHQWFDASGSTTAQVSRLDQAPSLDWDQPDQGGGVRAALGGGGAPIVLAGGRLTIDRHLVLDSGTGPMVSPAGPDPMVLRAGGSVRLTGGHLDLNQLSASAGSAADPGLIRLTATGEGTSGALALQLRQGGLTAGTIQLRSDGTMALSDVELRAADPAGQGGGLVLETGLGGATQLRNATLSARAITIRADGELDARNLLLRAGQPGQPGGMQLQAGAGQARSVPMRLENADLEGGEILLRSAGPLTLHSVRAEANSRSGSGRMGLEAGGGDPSRGTIELRQARFSGSEILVEGSAGLRGTEVQASATPAGAVGTIWFVAGRERRPEADASMDLRDLRLRGTQIGLQAPDGLKGQGWTVDARGTASTPGELLLATGTSTVPGSGGLASLDTARLTADRLHLRAGGGYRLKRVAIQAARGAREGTPEGLIQLDTGLAPSGDAAFPERPVGGKGHLEDVKVSGQRLVVLAGEGLRLQNVSAVAGPAGERGLVWLEAGAGAEPAAPVTLEHTRLEGQQILVRSGELELQSSALKAPKGVIHLEARGAEGSVHGNVRLEASTLDVGVKNWEDLKRDLRFVQVIDGVEIVKNLVPSIGLFATGTLDVLAASLLSASQDFNWIDSNAAGQFRELARLADTSGVILLDADQSVRVQQSTVRADATHTLAGDVILRSKRASGAVGVSVEASTLSASGGAGAGDIRLRSSSGITVEAGSVLRANSPSKPTTSLFNLYGGGGISLVNDSPQTPIAIQDAKLIAQQFTGGGVFSPFSLNGGMVTQFADPFDDADQQRLQTQGGAITLLSTGGIRIEGSRALLAVDSQANDPQTSEAFGGIIRLINTRQDTPIAIVNKATLRLDVNPVASTPVLLAGKPELHIWNQGPILLDEMTVSARNLLAEDGERFNALISVASQSGLQVSRSRFSLTSTTEAGAVMTPNLAFQVTQPETTIFNAPLITSGRQSFRAADFVTALTPEQFEEIRPPAKHEDGWHGSEYVYFNAADNVASDPWIDGGEAVEDPIPNRIALQATPKAAVVRVFRSGREPQILQPRIPGLPAPSTGVPSASPMVLAPPPPSVEPFVEGTRIPVVGTAARLERKLALASMEASPPATATLASPSPRPMAPKEAEEALAQGEESALQSILARLAPAHRSQRSFALPTLQEALRASVRRAGYNPAILRINVSPSGVDGRVQLDQILIPAGGEMRGWRTLATREQVRSQIKSFQRALSQQLPSLPEARALTQTLLGPILPDLERLGINALLLSLDRELQSLPFSALPLTSGVLGDKVALTVTPTLRLTDLAPPVEDPAAQTLLAGATRFRNGLAPLPMARQELEQIAALLPGSLILLDDAFSLGNLRGKLKVPTVRRLHLATHADFRVDDSQSARLFTANGELNLAELRRDLQERGHSELDLVVLSACRTALGDEERELGIAGLALQTGATSALGTLWYVDDAASAAFSVQFHSYLRQGFNKDQALQATQAQFRQGAVRVVSDQIVNAVGQPLVSGLSRADQVRLEGGLGHPYYWAGMVLSGRPW